MFPDESPFTDEIFRELHACHYVKWPLAAVCNRTFCAELLKKKRVVSAVNASAPFRNVLPQRLAKMRPTQSAHSL